MAAARRAGFVAAALFIYVAVSIGIQAGVRPLGKFLLGSLIVALVLGLAFGLLRLRVSSILLAAILPVALWLGVWGSYSVTRDLLGAALALALAWPAARLLTRRREPVDRPKRRLLRRYLLISVALVWIVNSALDVAFESDALPRRQTPLATARTPGAPWPTVRVGVALSGGGYRAALMHAGVLAELDAMRVPVTSLSTVSGGSIVGSYYAAGGAPESFRDALVDGRLNLKRDLADVHNALRLPFPFKLPYLQTELFPWYRFGRVDVQADLVDRVLLDGTTLGDLGDRSYPRLQICTTDLRSGAAVGLAADGVALRSPARPAPDRAGGTLPYRVTRDFRPSVDPTTRVAELVAASGAFPGAFSAVEMTLPATGNEPPRPVLLADGGIVDNWGVGLLLDRAQADGEHPWRIDVLLVSAGGRLFDEDEEVPAPEELRRAIDIVYETAGWRPVELVDARARPPIVLVQPADLDPASANYRAFAESSTLTDRFSAEQAARLFELGRELVRNASGELRDLLDAAAARSAE